MAIPSMPLNLMYRVYRHVLPEVHRELAYWRNRANEIPNPELRRQALSSIEHKTFHCEGGAILSLTANDHFKQGIRFIVAYQTISDYLDNLCDRSTSLDPADFAALHESMADCFNLTGQPTNYYREREDQDDGGYLQELVAVCREVLAGLDHYVHIKEQLEELCGYYCDLQIHKHVQVEERLPRLQSWFDGHRNHIPEMEWYEFSACAGSTLGIFSLVSYGLRDDFKPEYAASIRNGYFPYIQGLHILLDYFIDQEEDRAGGDLNFCSYYENEEALFGRLKHFVKNADYHTAKLPHRKFHLLINRGLLGVYLSDEKVRGQKRISRLAKEMIRAAGPVSYFFYINGRAYRSLQKWAPTALVRALIK